MKISCAVFDLDGTLLTSQNRISETDLKTLRDLSREGVKIIIATGRSLLQIREYVHTLGIADPVITCNGGVVLNPTTGEIILERFLRSDDAKRILSSFINEGADFLFYTRDAIYHSVGSVRIDFYKNYNNGAKDEFKVPIKSFSEYCNEKFDDIHKILICDKNERVSELYDTFNDKGTLTVISSGKDLIDIMCEETSKGHAIKVLAEHLNIPISEIVAFGDSPNDEEMLSAAGFSVAMGNAEETVKKVADFVTKTNDELGITYALNHIKNI